MAENEVRLDSLPLVRSKEAGGLVERRNIDPRDLDRRVALREGSERLDLTELPRTPGLGGWSDTETSCLISLGDHSSIFEFAQTGHTTGFDVCFEFRPGTLSYEANKETEVILWRWGGKKGQAAASCSFVVDADGNDPTPKLVFRLINGSDKSETELVIGEADSQNPTTTDKVYYVCVGVTSKNLGPSANLAVIRFVNEPGGTVYTVTTANGYGANPDGVTGGGSVTDSENFIVETAGEHSDLTILGARSRAEHHAEPQVGPKVALGARPAVSNFKVFSQTLSDAQVQDVLGKDYSPSGGDPVPVIDLPLSGDDYKNQAAGVTDQYVALSPAPPRVIHDDGDSYVLFNGENTYGYVPYHPTFDKFFQKDASPGNRSWSAYVEFEVPDRVSFFTAADNQTVTLLQMRGLFSIDLVYDSGASGYRLSGAGIDLNASGPPDPTVIVPNQRYTAGLARSDEGFTLSLYKSGTSYTEGLTYSNIPPVINYAKLPEFFVGAFSNATTGAMSQHFGGKIYGFAFTDSGGLGLTERTGKISDGRDEQLVFMFLAEEAVRDRMIDAGPYQFEAFFDYFSSDGVGSLSYTRGTRGTGEYLAAFEGLALGTDGPSAVNESDEVKRFKTTFKRTFDANTSSVRSGSKVFGISNSTPYVLDATSRQGRPLGLQKILGNPSLTATSGGVLDDVYAYGYRWVSSDGTKGPFSNLGQINVGEDARVVIGESALLLGLDYVKCDLDKVTQVGDTEVHVPVRVTSNKTPTGGGFVEGETFTYEAYVRIPEATGATGTDATIRETIWDSGMRVQGANDYWRSQSGSGPYVSQTYRGGLAHSKEKPRADWQDGFTHIVAFELLGNVNNPSGGSPTSSNIGDSNATYDEVIVLSSRAPKEWRPTYVGAATTDGSDEQYWPDTVSLDVVNGKFNFRNNKNTAFTNAKGTWSTYQNTTAQASITLREPVEEGDRFLVAHTCTGDDAQTGVTHRIIVKHIYGNGGRYATAEFDTYETNYTVTDDSDWRSGSFFLAGLCARDAAVLRYDTDAPTGSNVSYQVGTADAKVTEMPSHFGKLSGSDLEASGVVWYCHRLISGVVASGDIFDKAELVFLDEASDGPLGGRKILEAFCRRDDILDGYVEGADTTQNEGATLHDASGTKSGSPRGASSLLGNEGYADDTFFNEVDYLDATYGDAFWLGPWKQQLDEHFVVLGMLNEDPTGSGGVDDTHRPVFAIAFTPFGDGSYQIFIDDDCVYRECRRQLKDDKLDQGAMVDKLSVDPSLFHFVTASFDTSASATDTVFTVKEVFIGGYKVFDKDQVTTLKADTNTPLWHIGAGPTHGSQVFPNQGGLARFDIGDVRFWNGDIYDEREDFGYSLLKLPSNLYPDMKLYFDIRPNNRITGPVGDEFHFTNQGTQDIYDPDDLLVFTGPYHELVGETADTTSPLPEVPEPYIIGLELGRTARFGLEGDAPPGELENTELQNKLIEASNGPYYILDFVPRGQKIYIDNIPDQNLGVPIDPGAGDYPREATGVARWGQHLVLWGDPGAPSTLFVSEPGIFGFESYPNTLRFDTSIPEIKAVLTVGNQALAFGDTSMVALGADPSNPQEVHLGSGVGAQSARAAGTFDGDFYCFNGRMWMVSPNGEALDIGRPIQDLLPTNGRIRFSGVLSSMLLIDEDDGRVLRFYLPTKEWFVEDRNARDCFESGGSLYWISRSGCLAKDQVDEASPKYGDDAPNGLAAEALTATGAVTKTVTVSEDLPTDMPSPYNDGSYYDLKGVKVLHYPAPGSDPLEYEVVANTQNTMIMSTAVSELATAITAGGGSATVWVGANPYGLVLDTGWFPAGSQDSVLGGMRHSIQAGAYWRSELDSREFQGDVTEEASWSYADGVAVSGDGEHSGGTRGKFHRARIQSAPPSESRASYISMKLKEIN